MTLAKRTARDIVVDRLLERIESDNVLPWKAAWFCRSIPYNHSTMTRYRGLNVLVLWALGRDYDQKGFMTYRQASSLGGHVREGEKGFPVLFAQTKEVDLKDKHGVIVRNHDGTPMKTQIWMNRYYTVFNVAQIDGLPERPIIEASNRTANKIVDALQLTIEDGDPAYSPVRDAVMCPPVSDFTSEAEYYAALFHELIHWTGHQSRLNRWSKSVFGDEKYSKEELVAEIGASFLMAECGLFSETEESNAAYIKGWLSKLKNDKNMIITAASAAQKAVDYILSYARPNAT